MKPASGLPTAEPAVYRPPKGHLALDLVGSAFFLVMTLAGIALPLANPDGSFPRPALFATTFGCLGGAMTLLGVYALVAWHRMRVDVSAGAVRYVGVFRSRTVPVAEVARAVWRGWPAGGSVVLHTGKGRLAVYFRNYARGAALASYFRTTLPPQVQTGYEQFESTSLGASQVTSRKDEPSQRTHHRPRLSAILVGTLIFGAILVAVGVLAWAGWLPLEPRRAILFAFLLLSWAGLVIVRSAPPGKPQADNPPDGG